MDPVTSPLGVDVAYCRRSYSFSNLSVVGTHRPAAATRFLSRVDTEVVFRLAAGRAGVLSLSGIQERARARTVRSYGGLGPGGVVAEAEACRGW